MKITNLINNVIIAGIVAQKKKKRKKCLQEYEANMNNKQRKKCFKYDVEWDLYGSFCPSFYEDYAYTYIYIIT